jgi:hypothetical protein
VRLHPRGSRRRHRFPASPLARWLLPNNDCFLYLFSGLCLATDVYATIIYFISISNRAI